MSRGDFGTIAVEADERGVTHVMLNRAGKRNALSAEMIEELRLACARIGEDVKTRVVVLSGRGDVFCAGGDLDWMKAQMAAGREERVIEARKLAELLHSLNRLPKPLIGRLHGGAFGGGVGLACVCDFSVATADTRFGLTETRLGLIPATIGPYVIARMGEGPARQVFMSGRTFDASEAKALGLISAVANADDLDAAVEQQIAPYLSAAPKAVAAAKALSRSLGPAITPAIIEDSVNRLADVWETPEAAEGIDAFFAGRKPDWTAQ